MQRRTFLKGAVVAAAVPAVVSAALKTSGVRVSCEKGDPGYEAFCIANGDGKKVTVFLNGEEQRCITADECTGMIKRPVLTPSGNVARGHDEFLTEEVFGDVRVVIS